MNRIGSLAKLATVTAVSLLVCACSSSYQARKVDVQETRLVNPELYQKGKGDQALYRYVSPSANMKQYDKVMVDQVIVTKDGELDKDELANYQALANNAYLYLVRELQNNGFRVVQSPEPGTARVQMAIVDADKSKPVRNTLSTFMPIGVAVSGMKYATTGKQSGVGEITTELKITDASTGELLGAALDRRVGGKELNKLWSGWANADAALQYWAKRLAYVMCDMRGAGNCVKPS